MERQELVAVELAAPQQEPVLQNLMQLYVHDFSEYWGGTARGELDARGLFEPYPLGEYWTQANWAAHLIWVERALAGFCLINDRTHSGLKAERNMAEFFIVRKHRGRGAGALAAEIIFLRYPGSWEIAVARKNTRAREFWRNTVKRSGRCSAFEELDLQDTRWNGPIFRFAAAALDSHEHRGA